MSCWRTGLSACSPSTRVMASTVAHLRGQAGDTVSLLPFNGDAHGIETAGLEYPLRNESLFVGPARGVSNVMLAGEATVALQAGMLLCVVTESGE